MLLPVEGALIGDCPRKWEEGVGDGRSVWPESPGLHARDNGWDRGLRPRKREPIPKPNPSSDRGLKLNLVTPESLVSERHHRSLNISLLLAHTARQAIRVELQGRTLAKREFDLKLCEEG